MALYKYCIIIIIIIKVVQMVQPLCVQAVPIEMSVLQTNPSLTTP